MFLLSSSPEMQLGTYSIILALRKQETCLRNGRLERTPETIPCSSGPSACTIPQDETPGRNCLFDGNQEVAPSGSKEGNEAIPFTKFCPATFCARIKVLFSSLGKAVGPAIHKYQKELRRGQRDRDQSCREDLEHHIFFIHTEGNKN